MMFVLLVDMYMNGMIYYYMLVGLEGCILIVLECFVWVFVLGGLCFICIVVVINNCVLEEVCDGFVCDIVFVFVMLGFIFVGVLIV